MVATFHHSVVQHAGDCVSNLVFLPRVIGKQQVHLYAAKHFGCQFCRTSFGNAQLWVNIYFGNDFARLGIVVVQVADNTHAEAVGKDRAGFCQPIDILEFHVEIAGGLEHIYPFQVVDAVYQYAKCSYACYSYSNFFVIYFMMYLCYLFLFF